MLQRNNSKDFKGYKNSRYGRQRGRARKHSYLNWVDLRHKQGFHSLQELAAHRNIGIRSST